ncbi:MAG: hypothetical protein QOI44_1518 [Actinomycetota bacterium]|nr:hypothetical protein [Actinomycetota bacterium]
MQPSRARMLWRGLTRRCPRCGSGHLFRHWVKMVPDCPRCGLHFEREAGYWTGAMAINVVLVGGVFTVLFVIAIALTIPDVPVAPLLAFFVPFMLLAPLVAYPVSKTLWVAIDRAYLQRLGGNDRADEQVKQF